MNFSVRWLYKKVESESWCEFILHSHSSVVRNKEKQSSTQHSHSSVVWNKEKKQSFTHSWRKIVGLRPDRGFCLSGSQRAVAPTDLPGLGQGAVHVKQQQQRLPGRHGHLHSTARSASAAHCSWIGQLRHYTSIAENTHEAIRERIQQINVWLHHNSNTRKLSKISQKQGGRDQQLWFNFVLHYVAENVTAGMKLCRIG